MLKKLLVFAAPFLARKLMATYKSRQNTRPGAAGQVTAPPSTSGPLGS